MAHATHTNSIQCMASHVPVLCSHMHSWMCARLYTHTHTLPSCKHASHIKQAAHSVENTPVHTGSLQPSSPSKNDSGRRSPSISSLFDSGSSKRSIFKKLFGRKPSATKQRSMTVMSGADGGGGLLGWLAFQLFFCIVL